MLSERTKNEILLALAGFNLIILNYTLIRQLTIAFRDLETSALLMALAYFAGISLGYVFSARVSPAVLRALLPVYLIGQLALMVVAPLLVVRLDRLAGPALTYTAFVVLVTLASTSLYSIFLPRMIEAGEGSTRRCYAIEIAGSLCGLVSLPLLGLGGMTVFHAAYLATFLSIAALLKLRPLLLGALVILSVAFLFAFDPIDKAVSAVYYKDYYDWSRVRPVIYTRYSPYHKIEVLESQGGNRSLVLNAHMQFSPSGHLRYSYFVAEYPARLLSRPSVCLLGCGSMSTVGRMGDHVASIQIVDLDRAVFETSRDFFPQYNRLSELRNWSFRSDDAKHFLATTPDRFDLIIDDIPPAKTRQIALTYTKEFFELVRSRLTPGGIFSLPSLTPVHSKRAYGRRMLATLAEVFDQVYVLDDGGDSYYFATDRTLVLDEERLRQAIDHPDKDALTILVPSQVRDLVRGVKTISVDNMADLILY